MAMTGISNWGQRSDIAVEIWKQVMHESVKETSVKSLPRTWYFFFPLKHIRITRSDSKQFQNALRFLFAFFFFYGKLTRIAKGPFLVLKFVLHQRNTDYILRKK